MTDFDRLDRIADQVRTGDLDEIGVLSSGERIYVLLAANRPDLLMRDGIVYSLKRLGSAWLNELIVRHQND